MQQLLKFEVNPEIANVLRTVDPQTMGQPCGRDSRPIWGGVDEPRMKPQHAIVVLLGPIETPAADFISHYLTLSAEFVCRAEGDLGVIQ